MIAPTVSTFRLPGNKMFYSFCHFLKYNFERFGFFLSASSWCYDTNNLKIQSINLHFFFFFFLHAHSMLTWQTRLSVRPSLDVNYARYISRSTFRATRYKNERAKIKLETIHGEIKVARLRRASECRQKAFDRVYCRCTNFFHMEERVCFFSTSFCT